MQRSAEDWLRKVLLGKAMVDLVHSVASQEVSRAMLHRAEELPGPPVVVMSHRRATR
ncbi:MAG: hypothetical protein ACYCO3_00775 [Mycobacteriales bacterium]